MTKLGPHLRAKSTFFLANSAVVEQVFDASENTLNVGEEQPRVNKKKLRRRQKRASCNTKSTDNNNNNNNNGPCCDRNESTASARQTEVD